MLPSFRAPLAAAVDDIRKEAERRKETTPGDVSIEAWEYAANRFERAIAEADEATKKLTPTEYAAQENVTPQTVTRWIRVGELEAEETPNGYLIAREAVHRTRMATKRARKTA